MFEFSTKLGKDELMALNKFHSFKKNRKFIAIFCAVFIFIGLMMFLTAETQEDKVFAIIYGAGFALGFPIFLNIFMRIMVKISLKSSSFISDENKNYFKFDDEEIFHTSEKTDMKSTMTAKWNLVFKAFETKTHYYIYISNMQAYIIPKNSIITGDYEVFSAFLKEKLGKKFIVK